MLERSYAWPEGYWDWYQHLAFKHGIRVGEMAFVGGQVDKTPSGEPLRAYDLASQTEVVIRHIDTVLKEFGAGLGHVVKLVAFYANDGSVDEPAFLERIGQHVLSHTDASERDQLAITLVPLPCLALPGMMVEIEVIAVLDREGERRERIAANPPALSPMPPPFCHGICCGDHVWTSAQPVPSLPRRMPTPGDLSAQTDVAMAHLKQVLDALGAELDGIVNLRTW